MDELLIEDKKYVSSKRAAKMTGYAKDYIGQLCREGRVPARLVGRSWYVLETAIQDHRFGVNDIQPEESVQSTPVEPVIPTRWESPRYESASDELLPSVNRLRTEDIGDNNEEITDSERLQDTWKTWFDRIAENETTTPVVEKVEKDTAPMSEIGAPTESVGEEKIEEEKPVDVPIHAVYRKPPEELLPRSFKTEEENEPAVIPKVKKSWSRASIVMIQAFSVLIAVAVASLAMIGSGYLDKYVISISQVRIIAGVGLYNK